MGYTSRTSLKIRKVLVEASAGTNISIVMNSLDAMLSFKLSHPMLSDQVLRAIVIDRMRQNGFLFSTTIYPSLSHSSRHINKLGRVFKQVLLEISILLLEENGVEALNSEFQALGPLASGFGRTQKL